MVKPSIIDPAASYSQEPANAPYPLTPPIFAPEFGVAFQSASLQLKRIAALTLGERPEGPYNCPNLNA